MAGGAADERHAPAVPRLEHPSQEMASLPIPDELTAEIFLRLPTPADLARASAACVSFRRVAANRSFLRRFRKLHAPPLLGFFDTDKVFYPVIAPHASASAASAVAWAADFSFSFLPQSGWDLRDWEIRDMCDGRVLLCRWCSHAFPEAVVCDPLYRRYLLLPKITDGLPALANCADIFLVPPDYGEEAAATADETSFTVILMANCKTGSVAFVFSSNTGQWTDFSAGLPPLPAISGSRQYVYDCFYWMTTDCQQSKLLVLHSKTMEFSIAEHPKEDIGCYNFAMVEAGKDRPGMFVLADDETDDDGTDITYFIRQNDGGSTSQWQWQWQKKISLRCLAFLICNTEKYLVLCLLESGCFTLDIETFKLQKLCAVDSVIYRLHAYSNFPPNLLSSPTISSGVEEGPEQVLPYFSPKQVSESPWSPWSE